MTPAQVLKIADSRFPNLYGSQEKLGWLEEVEGMVHGTLEAFHAVRGSFEGLQSQQELLLPRGYSALYLLWLEGSIHYADQEYGLYNNAMARFNTLWREFFAWCCRTIPQPGKSIRYI